MSRQKQVSVTTVLQAYYQLEARGVVEARPRSGFYVNRTLPRSAGEPKISSPNPDPAKVSIRELVMMVAQRDIQHPDLVHLGAANPAPDISPPRRLSQILSRLARKTDTHLSQYDPPPGCEPLRIQIARQAVTAGCMITADDIVTTAGCTESTNLCLRAVCKPGDTVAIESPTSFDVLQCLEALGLNALEIPTGPRDGISLEALEFAIGNNPVSACLVIPNFNNPLGSLMPDDRKRDMVELLARHEIPLIEDDVFGDIHFTEKRPLAAKAFDRKGLVMYCSSFSKSVCTGLRLGWVVPGRFKARVEWLKYTTNIGTSTLPQFAMAEYMAGGHYPKHLRRIRQIYDLFVGEMRQAVIRHFPAGIRVTRPAGGFVLWIELPRSVDALALYKVGLENGIAILPGHIFSATDRYNYFIRLNAASWSPAAEAAIRTLGDLVRTLSR